MKALLILLGSLVLVPAMILYGALSWGYVMTKLWIWYILPVFPTMPHITFYQAVGLIVFMTLFKNHGTLAIKDEYKDKYNIYTETVFGPWLTLFAGWVVYLFIH